MSATCNIYLYGGHDRFNFSKYGEHGAYVVQIYFAALQEFQEVFPPLQHFLLPLFHPLSAVIVLLDQLFAHRVQIVKPFFPRHDVRADGLVFLYRRVDLRQAVAEPRVVQHLDHFFQVTVSENALDEKKIKKMLVKYVFINREFIRRYYVFIVLCVLFFRICNWVAPDVLVSTAPLAERPHACARPCLRLPSCVRRRVSTVRLGVWTRLG